MLHFKYCMKKIALLFFTGILAVASLGIQSCVKKGNDVPEDQTGFDPKLQVTHTIAQLLAMPVNTAITDEVVISGIVVMDDRSGNYYKKFVIQDETGGIEINLDQNNIYNDYPVGRKVYIKCKGLTLTSYGGNPQLGYGIDERQSVVSIPFVMADDYIVKANYPNEIKIDTFTFDELYNIANNKQNINRLVAIKDVQFSESILGSTYAQANTTTDRQLEGCGASNTGDRFVVRTSNYARFQGVRLPSGSGVIVGLYTVFTNQSKAQLVIRDTADVKFGPARCDGSTPNFQYVLNEDFANMTNWSAVSVTGDQVWVNDQNYGNPRPSAVMTGYAAGSRYENEDWLISKALNFSAYNTITLNFETAAKYGGDVLECYISTDYTSGDPNAATWTVLPATFADVNGNFVWTPSGDIDLTSYKSSSNVRIAFKYKSTTSTAATWELDNVKIKGE